MQEIQETWVQSLSQKDLLEKEMAICSSILAQKIPWAEESGGLQSMGLQRVRHNWSVDIPYCMTYVPKIHWNAVFSSGDQILNFKNQPPFHSAWEWSPNHCSISFPLMVLTWSPSPILELYMYRSFTAPPRINKAEKGRYLKVKRKTANMATVNYLLWWYGWERKARCLCKATTKCHWSYWWVSCFWNLCF